MHFMLRRAAVIAAGLAMATSFGLSSVGKGSASVPALKIKPFATWTVEFKQGKLGSCELVSFNTFVNTFVADHDGEAGTWSSGRSTISMTWTVGPDAGLTFAGHFVSTTTPVEFRGAASNVGYSVKTMLVKGVLTSYRGVPC
jgi:hypothetical protein